MRRGQRGARTQDGIVEGGTVTLVFTDLVGSTELIERLGDSRSEQLIRDHLKRLRRVVESYKGRVVKSLGDGLMAAFTSSTTAIDCAVAMQQTVERAGEDPEERLQLRVGLHAGEAVYDGDDYYGRAVWIAQRLCDASGAGDITTSEIVKELVGDRGGHQFTDIGLVNLKGLSEPMLAYRIGWPHEGEIATHPGEPRSSSRPTFIVVAAAVLVAITAVVFLVRPDDVPEEGPSSSGDASPTGGEQPSVDPRVTLVSTRAEGSVGDEPHGEPAVSGDGSIVAFVTSSRMTNADGNGFADVYVHAGEGEAPLLISADSATGEEGDAPSGDPAISPEGRFVSFRSNSSNLTSAAPVDVAQVYLFDRSKGELRLVSVRRNGEAGNRDSLSPSVSSRGEAVAFASDASNLSVLNDRNDVRDVFVHRRDGSTIRISVGPRGIEANGPSDSPAISANANFIAYVSDATNLVRRDSQTRDVFVWNVLGRTTSKVSVGMDGRAADGPSDHPAISSTGSRIAFDSSASNLVTSDENRARDVFVATRSGRIDLISVNEEGRPANGDSRLPQISADGRYVAFVSEASDLVEGDDNGLPDVFFRDLKRGETHAVSVDRRGVLVGATDEFALSADGRYVAFVAPAAEVMPVVGRDVPVVFARGPLI